MLHRPLSDAPLAQYNADAPDGRVVRTNEQYLEEFHTLQVTGVYCYEQVERTRGTTNIG